MTTGMIAALTELAGQCQAELGNGITAWREGAGAGVRLWCGPGCGNCCTLTVNCTLAEALAIRDTLDETLRQHLDTSITRTIAHARSCVDTRAFLAGYRQAVGPCPFLDDDANCSIYAVRPLACRALLSTRPADWCGVNLAALPESEREAFLASLDRKVVAFPTHYAAAPRELAANFERGLIIAMIRVTGFAVTGSLPLLVWLAGQPGFDQVLAAGPSAFASLLADNHADRPFLAQVDTP